MAKFTLYYRGATLPAFEDRQKIKATPGLKVLEDTLPRLLTVEADEAALEKTVSNLPGWVMTLETQIDTSQLKG